MTAYDKYGFTIRGLDKTIMKPNIEQIYDIFLRENTYTMLKTQLTQLLSDSRTRQRLLEEEIANAKQLFESFTKATNDDNDDNNDDDNMRSESSTQASQSDADSQFDFIPPSQYREPNSYYMESKPIPTIFTQSIKEEDGNDSKRRKLGEVRRGGTNTEKRIYYKRYHKKQTTKKTKNNKTKSTKNSKNRRTKKRVFTK